MVIANYNQLLLNLKYFIYLLQLLFKVVQLSFQCYLIDVMVRMSGGKYKTNHPSKFRYTIE